MNIIRTPYNVNLVAVPTEQHISLLLSSNVEKINSKYNYVDINIASCIKKHGVITTQEILNPYLKPENFFVNQHIESVKLNFRNSLVFSTHASKDSSVISIPHYSLHSDHLDVGRDILFSFMGSVTTHWIRKQLVDMYETCIDSGVLWSIDPELSIEERARLKSRYVELTNTSMFSICPRGTGVGTIRLFEVMSMGSIPVIISDDYVCPLSNKINWDEFSIRIPESDVHKIEKILNSIGHEEIKKMRSTMKDNYEKYFSNDNLHQTIKKYIENE